MKFVVAPVLVQLRSCLENFNSRLKNRDGSASSVSTMGFFMSSKARWRPIEPDQDVASNNRTY